MGSLEISWLRPMAVALVLFASHAPAWAGPAEDDFDARCTALGVLICNGMNTRGGVGSDIIPLSTGLPNSNMNPATGGTYRDSIDTTIKMSGAGSLKFTLPAGNNQDDMTGAFYCCGGTLTPILPGTGLGQQFGAGSTFYVQFAVRWSPEMKSNLAQWNSQWKVAVLFGGLTCGDATTNAELAINLSDEATTGFLEDIIYMYKDCGANPLYTSSDEGTWKSLGAGQPWWFQHDATGPLNCQWTVWANCWRYPTNTWVTLYFKIHNHAPLGSVGSTVEAWYSINRQPYVKWINVTQNFRITSSKPFDNILLAPFMSGLTQAASATAFVWYDELIVSIQPIAAPGGTGVPPTAPTNLIIQ